MLEARGDCHAIQFDIQRYEGSAQYFGYLCLMAGRVVVSGGSLCGWAAATLVADMFLVVCFSASLSRLMECKLCIKL